ncbi:phenylalanine--tRNA ligase subunit alpha [Candidatus Parcubacteria bacterium]|nr:MAG: phenylalanine--tRNA ligase subunit alpha [Candidatus Parcubacteria bacterium]
MSLEEQLKQLRNKFLHEIGRAKNIQALSDLEIKFLGRKGEMSRILKGLKNLSGEEKPKIGALANELKNQIVNDLNKASQVIKGEAKEELIDLTLPGKKVMYGRLHPITLVKNELADIFTSMSFMVLDGPEAESDFYNFESLNIPPYHPARDMQDTFYLKDGNVLRTQTSNMQVRAMQKYGPPLRAVFPGRVFRNEATDASHETNFFQFEGLMIDKDINIGNLVATMQELISGVLKKQVEVRLRPGYFPFVEPGFEMDVECLNCGGKGCPVCKHSGWVEIFGCGLVHPNVLKYGGIDPKKWSGFAFGLGLNRLVMVKYGINDIRLFMSGDLRFLKQF